MFSLQSDVNTVCFADEGGHLIYSGSDDTLCKVICHCNTCNFAFLLYVHHGIGRCYVYFIEVIFYNLSDCIFLKVVGITKLLRKLLLMHLE